MNIATIAEMSAQGRPDGVAVGSQAAGLTYGQLYDHSRAVAAWLAARQVTRVILVDTNSVAAPILLFGCALGGATYVPLNYRLPDAELAALVVRNAPCLVVTGNEMIDRLQPVTGVTSLSRTQLLEIAATPPPTTGPAATDDDTIAALIHTSGTSGAPKAAVLRHSHLSAYVLSTVEFMGAAPDEAAVVSLPPYHVAGVSAILTGVFAGRRMLYLESFDAAEWVQLVDAEHVTHAMVVPTMLERILDVVEANEQPLPRLRHLSYGGGRMPLPVIERALRLLPHVGFVNAYGLTETSSTIAVLTAEDHRTAGASKDPAVHRRLTSVGRPIPTLDLEIRDDAGQPVTPGEPGEVYVRGAQVAGEYIGADSGTRGGWFATKDGGYLDLDGYLYLLGRLDDVIVRGGENISPGEIEDVLLRHPAVAEAAVIGLPDVQWGELVTAVIVLDPAVDKPAVAELQQWARASLRSSRVPGRIVFAESLPYGDSGKLLRRTLRTSYANQSTMAGDPS